MCVTGYRPMKREPSVKRRAAVAKKTKTKTKEHPCIARVDRALAPRGYKLKGAIYLSGASRDIFVQTEALDEVKKKHGLMLAATFCPFCGKKVNP